MGNMVPGYLQFSMEALTQQQDAYRKKFANAWGPAGLEAYQEQARAALSDLFERIGPAVVAKQRISVAEFDAIPTFAFRDRSLAQKAASFAAPLSFLFVASALLLALARRRMGAPLEKLL